MGIPISVEELSSSVGSDVEKSDSAGEEKLSGEVLSSLFEIGEKLVAALGPGVIFPLGKVWLMHGCRFVVTVVIEKVDKSELCGMIDGLSSV